MGVLLLVQSYIAVSEPEFLSLYIDTVVEVLEFILSTVRPRTAAKTIEAVSLFIQLYPQQAPPHLQSLLKRCFELALSKSGNTMLETQAGLLLIRLPTLNKQFFLDFIQHQVVGTQKSSLALLLDLWLERARNLDYIQEEKTWICGLSSLLVTQDPAILAYCTQIIDCCVVLFHDLRAKESDAARKRSATYSRELRVLSGSHFERVLKQVDRRDVAYWPHHDIQRFFIDRLRECTSLNGSQFESQIFNAISFQSRQWIQNPPPPIQSSNSYVINLLDDEE